MQIWNMKMKMGVIKVIYEALQGHLWRRHDSLVSFMRGRPSFSWQASLPGEPILPRRGGPSEREWVRECWVPLSVATCDGEGTRTEYRARTHEYYLHFLIFPRRPRLFWFSFSNIRLWSRKMTFRLPRHRFTRTRIHIRYFQNRIL